MEGKWWRWDKEDRTLKTVNEEDRVNESRKGKKNEG